MMRKKLSILLIFSFGLISLFVFTNFSFKEEKIRHKTIYLGKTRTAFSSEIKIISSSENSAKLKALVYRRSNSEGFEYEWKLPDGVQMISGSLSGYISDTSKKEYSFLVEVSWADWPKDKLLFFHIKTPSHLGRTTTWKPEFNEEQDMALKANQKVKTNKKPEIPSWMKVMQ